MCAAYGPREKLSNPAKLVKAALQRARAPAGRAHGWSAFRSFAALAFAGAALAGSIARADDDVSDLAPPPPPGANGAAPVEFGTLPGIEAKIFDVSVVLHTKSNKVYLFNDVQDVKTSIGKLLLLRQGSESVMAFRIIKLYPERQQFAAVKVRTYAAYEELPTSTVFQAIEKVSDSSKVPPTTIQQKADLKELEANAPDPSSNTQPDDEILAYDPELDSGSSPPPGALSTAKEEPLDAEENPDIGSDEDISVEEIEEIDRNQNWLTAGFGIFSSSVPDDSSPGSTKTNFFTGGGLRYGRTLARHPYIYKAKVQDSIALEAGLFMYKVVGLTTVNAANQSDSYTVLSPVVTLRYNVQFGQTYSLFGYLGAMYHAVISYSEASADAVTALQGAIPAVGIGGSMQLGPNWYLRLDAGIDIVGVGLMLRY